MLPFYQLLYGTSLAALDILGALTVALNIDGYGPIYDNDKSISEVSDLSSFIRKRTDVLDAAGNKTTAFGKGFEICSTTLVGLDLFSAFVTRVEKKAVDILQLTEFSGLFRSHLK